MRRRMMIRPAFCLALALPALALRGDEREFQREKLVRTVGSLATYQDIERTLGAKGPDAPETQAAIAELLRLSEPGPADPARAEVTIEDLRLRINELQEILDARESLAPEAPVRSTGARSQTPQVSVLPTSMETHGAPAEPASAASGEKPPAPKEFIADRKRLGRACWRGGRYQEGVLALESLAGDPQADYWRARCLEKLGRPTEAVALYRAVIELAPETPEGRSAREDCEFLEWAIARGLVKQP